MAILTLPEACALLDVGMGEDDRTIEMFIEAIPHYIESTTGTPESLQTDDPLCQKAAGLILSLWYYGAGSKALLRSINSLLGSIAAKYELL